MPERDKARRSLVVDVVGYQVFNGLIGKTTSMPNDRYEQVSDTADMLFERIIDRIDWNRILLEAMNRHHELVRSGTHRETNWYAGITENEVCPDCLRESLLAEERFPRLDPQPAERRDDHRDVFGIFAKALKYRRS
jgi:hypothetical protein